MKKFILLAVLLSLSLPQLFAHEESLLGDFNDIAFNIREKKFKYEDADLFIYDKNDKYSDEILITAEYELYINHKKIRVDKNTSKLLKIYYQEIYDIREEALLIGIEGAKIGLSGAKLGLTAVISLPLLLFGNEEEFEDRMEEAGEELEQKGEELEEQGEKLEEKAESLEDLEDELRARVEELDDLFWF
ncbi:MAG: hypothetical protein JXQ65_01170 [Candidatus Marinimicrobia bacterium]|nr:hypothetical protein [Candidatus Neomarinimicrobiota bacterium]